MQDWGLLGRSRGVGNSADPGLKLWDVPRDSVRTKISGLVMSKKKIHQN